MRQPAGCIMLEPITTIQRLERLKREDGGWENVKFYNHDISKVDELKAIKGQKFDAITCASALVLLDSPSRAINQWAGLLKKGGKLVTDATHPRNLVSGIALETVSARLGVQPSWYRLWCQNEDSLKGLMESVGLRVEDIHLQHQMDYPPKSRRVEDGPSVWEKSIEGESAKPLRVDEVREKAREMFLEEWKLLADENGDIEDIDGVWIVKAIKTDDSPAKAPLMAGKCACGAVTWQAVAPPVAIVHCLCYQCRKVSESAFLTMMEFPYWAISFTPRVTDLKSVKLTPHARRSFCDRCGSTLTYQHFRSLDSIEVAMGSLDEETLNGITVEQLLKGVRRNWCWLKSKVGWWAVPDDDWGKCDAMTNDGSTAAMLVYKERLFNSNVYLNTHWSLHSSSITCHVDSHLTETSGHNSR